MDELNPIMLWWIHVKCKKEIRGILFQVETN